MSDFTEIVCVMPYGAMLPAGVDIHDPSAELLTRFSGHFAEYKAKRPKKVTIIKPVTVRRDGVVAVSNLPDQFFKTGQFEALNAEEELEDPDMLPEMTDEQRLAVHGILEKVVAADQLDEAGLPLLDVVNREMADGNLGLVLEADGLRRIWDARLGTLV